MITSDELKQFYFCSICQDFYEEHGIKLDFKTYLSTSIFDNLGNCPRGHARSIEKETIDYLLEKPEKIADSPIICLDIVGFSNKNQITKFNNYSVLHASCLDVINGIGTDSIYKGTGDGFYIGLPSQEISRAIDFCERLVTDYLKRANLFIYRIGIEYGTFFRYLDMNRNDDMFGQPLEDVTRIADFGNKNNILLSENATNNLKWSADKRKVNITELGYCFDKHRKRYKVFNYISECVGNEFA